MKTSTGIFHFCTRFFLTLLLITSEAQAQSAAPLQDVNFQFDPSKMEVASDAFHFMRSFVDYYYVLLAHNRSTLPQLSALSSQGGWCVGDAHPENFGQILQEDGSSLFAMNDVDDAGPCPLVLDLARLIVSSRVVNPGLGLSLFLDAYENGLRGQDLPLPAALQWMQSESLRKGFRPEKSKVQSGQLVRSSLTEEVPAALRSEIQTTIIAQLPHHAELVDAISTHKLGGGSGGLLRYELLFREKSGSSDVTDLAKNEIDLELKQEVAPAISSVATEPVPDLAARLAKTLAIEQGPKVSTYDAAFEIQGVSMILRPRFAGNIGVSLGNLSASDLNEVLRYEAWTLGRVHAQSLPDPESWIRQFQTTNQTRLDEELKTLSSFFQSKYQQLRNGSR